MKIFVIRLMCLSLWVGFFMVFGAQAVLDVGVQEVSSRVKEVSFKGREALEERVGPLVPVRRIKSRVFSHCRGLAITQDLHVVEKSIEFVVPRVIDRYGPNVLHTIIHNPCGRSEKGLSLKPGIPTRISQERFCLFTEQPTREMAQAYELFDMSEKNKKEIVHSLEKINEKIRNTEEACELICLQQHKEICLQTLQQAEFGMEQADKAVEAYALAQKNQKGPSPVLRQRSSSLRLQPNVGLADYALRLYTNKLREILQSECHRGLEFEASQICDLWGKCEAEGATGSQFLEELEACDLGNGVDAVVREIRQAPHLDMSKKIEDSQMRQLMCAMHGVVFEHTKGEGKKEALIRVSDYVIRHGGLHEDILQSMAVIVGGSSIYVYASDVMKKYSDQAQKGLRCENLSSERQALERVTMSGSRECYDFYEGIALLYGKVLRVILMKRHPDASNREKCLLIGENFESFMSERMSGQSLLDSLEHCDPAVVRFMKTKSAEGAMVIPRKHMRFAPNLRLTQIHKGLFDPDNTEQAIQALHTLNKLACSYSKIGLNSLVRLATVYSLAHTEGLLSLLA